MNKTIFSAAFLAVAIVASPAVAKKAPQLTPMELQSLQSREFKAPKDQVFSSIVSVFQDLGYQISEADAVSGFITAGSANKNKTGFFEALAGMSSSGGSRVTAFVETMPSGLTRARLNFMNTKNSSSAYGRTSSSDKPVLDPQTYQVAFERIEQALFERGALTKSAPATALPVVPQTPTTAAAPAPPTTVQAPAPAPAQDQVKVISVAPGTPQPQH